MNPLSFRLGVSLVLALVSIQAALAKPRLHVLRTSRGTSSSPVDISADGRVTVGVSYYTNTFSQAFRQVRLHKRQDIDMSIPVESGATAVSADGLVVLGFTYSAVSFSRSYRWTKETGPIDLSSNPELILYSYGLSANGRVVVGEYEHVTRVNNHRLPFCWSPEAGLEQLSTPDAGAAVGASYDGAVIVGAVSTTNGPFGSQACRWLNKGQPELLAPLITNSYATAVTPDGSIIVGGVNDPDGSSRAFRWLTYWGLEWINTGDSLHNFAIWDQSADATRIVGHARNANNEYVAALWTDQDGLQDLNVLYSSLLPRGFSFSSAVAISADGRWIVGALGNANDESKGYILDTGRVGKR